MPAQLLLVNPSKPRKGAKKKASPAQMAVRARFAAMARAGKLGGKKRKNPSKPKAKAKAKKATNAHLVHLRRQRALADRKAAASLAADMGTTARKEKTVSKKTTKKAAKKAPTKKAKRSAAAKKAARTRKRNAAKAGVAPAKKTKRRTKKASARKGTKKAARRTTRKSTAKRAKTTTRRRRRRGTRASRVVVGLRRKAKALRGRAKKSVGASRSILSMRARATSLKARAKGKSRKSKKTGKWIGLSPGQKRALKASGLMRVNPSMMSIIKDLGVLLPQVGVTVAGLAGIAWLGGKTIGKLREKAPTNTLLASAHAPAALSAGLGVLGYIAMRMIGSRPGSASAMINKLAPAVLMGGVAAAAVQTLSAVKVTGADGTQKALGAKLGLPIGEYVVGEYVVGSSFIDVDGARVGIDVGNMFSQRTLGEYVPYSVSDDGPREGGRGRRLETSAASIVRDELDAYDGKLPIEGNLSGSIFDD